MCGTSTCRLQIWKWVTKVSKEKIRAREREERRPTKDNKEPSRLPSVLGGESSQISKEKASILGVSLLAIKRFINLSSTCWSGSVVYNSTKGKNWYKYVPSTSFHVSIQNNYCPYLGFKHTCVNLSLLFQFYFEPSQSSNFFFRDFCGERRFCCTMIVSEFQRYWSSYGTLGTSHTNVTRTDIHTFQCSFRVKRKQQVKTEIEA